MRYSYGMILGLLLGTVGGPERALGQTSDPANRVSPPEFSDLRFRMVGPSRGGRVTAITGIPDQPLTFYMGASGGGVWKTTNAGIGWSNVSDGFFATGSIGDSRGYGPSDSQAGRPVMIGLGAKPEFQRREPL